MRASTFVKSHFDLDAAPEPYIDYNAGRNPLVVLLTNPGRTKPCQTRKAIRAGNGPLSGSMQYQRGAKSLGDYYQQPGNLKATPRRRIENLLSLSKAAGFDGVMAVECCPFHSPSLPKKDQLLREFCNDQLLRSYAHLLEKYLRSRCVLIVSAVSTRSSLASTSKLSDWLQWQTQRAGIDPRRSRFEKLVVKARKVTAAALVHKSDGAIKVLVRMMGGNHLPGEEGRRRLAALMRAS
jgi:hypothetical protein